MRTLQSQVTLLVVSILVAVVAALPVFLASAQGGEAGDGTDVVPGAVWTVVGIAIFAVVFGMFYLFKRRIGGFPRNPRWVAPITVMPSREFPDEGDYGDQVPSGQAHAEH
ncbi:MAG: hypothetical protein IT304_06355 [Dehalococcoidia bacterium]|nr:hypothetical protein [Dehalococcoidia bacterium]